MTNFRPPLTVGGADITLGAALGPLYGDVFYVDPSDGGAPEAARRRDRRGTPIKRSQFRNP